MSGTTREAARYRFGDSSRSGMLLGLSLRQGAPLVAGMLWLALALMIELPLVGLVGLALASVASFGRWRHTPLYDIAAPGARLGLRRLRGSRRMDTPLVDRRRLGFRRCPSGSACGT